MKETPEMIDLGVDAVELREAQKLLRKMHKKAEKIVKQLGKKGFQEHQFHGALATLLRADAAIYDVGQAHSDLTEFLCANGVEMCTDDEFKDAVDGRGLKSGPHR